MTRKPHPIECDDVEQANAGAVVKTVRVSDDAVAAISERTLCKSTERRYVEQLKAKDARIAELEEQIVIYQSLIREPLHEVEIPADMLDELTQFVAAHRAKAKGQGEGA